LDYQVYKRDRPVVNSDMVRQVLSSLRFDLGLDSSASTFRITLSQGFLYHCFTCRLDGREPHGSRLAFTGPARPFASQGFTPGQGNLLPSIGPVGSFGPEPTSRRWTGLHRL